MPPTDEVIELTNVLREEGFEFLAAEILAEIDLGAIGGDAEPVALSDDQTDDDADLRLKGISDDLERTPIPPEAQLAFAVQVLRRRLVEPARWLAEAERLATDVAGGEPVRFAFVDGEGSVDEVMSARSEALGGSAAADKLEMLLNAILNNDSQGRR